MEHRVQNRDAPWLSHGARSQGRDGRADPADGARRPLVAVDVTDPDLRDDVCAAVAAVGLDHVEPRPGSVAALVTDSAEPDVARARGLIYERLILVGAGPPGVPDDPPVSVTEGGDPAEPGSSGNPERIRLPDDLDRFIRILGSLGSGGHGAVLGVVGAVGGCGASVLAAALALRMARVRRTMLVETDPLGVGVDAIVGAELASGLRLDDLVVGLGHIDVGALWNAVPRLGGGLGVIARARRSTEAQEAPGVPALVHALRSAGDAVVCDAGRAGPGCGVVDLVDHLVLVTRADLSGALAARHALDALGPEVSASLVVRWDQGDPLHADEVAEACGVPDFHVVKGSSRLRRSLASGSSEVLLGRGAGGVGVAADRLLDLTGVAT